MPGWGPSTNTNVYIEQGLVADETNIFVKFPVMPIKVDQNSLFSPYMLNIAACGSQKPTNHLTENVWTTDPQRRQIHDKS